jgi:hypothetical protein
MLDNMTELELKASDYFKSGDYFSALEVYFILCSTELNQHWYHYHIANCYLRLGSLELATSHILI